MQLCVILLDLGAKLTTQNLKTFILRKIPDVPDQKIFNFYNPAHMLIPANKNAFHNRKVIKKSNSDLIEWNYLVKLENEQSIQRLQS